MLNGKSQVQNWMTQSHFGLFKKKRYVFFPSSPNPQHTYIYYFLWEKKTKKDAYWASLVAQWLRIRLPMQGTWVWALVQEDPTCHRATKPVSHNYWACALEPVTHNYWAHVTQLLKPACLGPVLCNKRSHCNKKPTHHNEEGSPCSLQLEKAHTQQWRPKAAKNK